MKMNEHKQNKTKQNKTPRQSYAKYRRSSFLGRIALLVLLTFTSSEIFPAYLVSSKAYAQTILDLPVPGAMVTFTPPLTPPLLIGLKIHPEHPLKFDFLLDRGDVKKFDGNELKSESTRLIKYFLAALTIPEKDLWVNLSPYEKDRIVSEQFGLTEMGRDLLGQDYLLKQLMASLTYPEEGLGKTFWNRVYQKAFELYGTTNIPLNTFNKVWIIPDSAEVFEKDNTAFIVNSHLKVMLEEDYLALKQNMINQKLGTDKLEGAKVQQISNVSSGIVKEVLLPEIEREVNEGKNFALLRQIYNSLILAIWYKKRLKDSLLGQVYVDQSKVKGVDADDPNVKEKIYQQYIEAFKQGVYNYIKEDYDPYMQKNIPRKYFSGGFGEAERLVNGAEEIIQNDPAMLSTSGEEHYERITQEIGKGEEGNDVVVQTQMAELNESDVIVKIKTWLNQRNEELREEWKKTNQDQEPPDRLPVSFTIDDLVQAGLGKKDIIQVALNNLKDQGFVFHQVKEVKDKWDGKSWVHRFGIGAASVGEFGENNITERDKTIIDRFNALQDVPKVVDMGSGSGSFSEEYRKKYPNEAIIGYELDETMAGNMFDKEWQVNVDAGRTRLLSNSVDKVTINMPDPKDVYNVIPHLLKEAQRILKPGGEIFIVFEALDRSDPFLNLIVRSAETDILSSLMDQGFQVEHKGRPLSEVEPNYPRTRMMTLYEEERGGVNLFKARKAISEGLAGDIIGVALIPPQEIQASPDYGGIDLTAVESNLQIKRDENGVPLPLPLQNISDIHLDGLKFIILNTAPASFHDFPFLVSLKGK